MNRWTTQWQLNTDNWEDYDYLVWWINLNRLWFNSPIQVGGTMDATKCESNVDISTCDAAIDAEQCNSKFTVDLANSNLESIMI